MESKKFLKLSILSISFLMMLRLTISSGLASIGEAVGKTATEMQIMVVVASIVAIPFGFAAGIAAGRIKKKTILYIGLILYIVGGLGPMLMADFTFMIICRALLGAGTGLFIPLATGLIADFYRDEEFNFMIGIQSTAVALGNIITSVLAGVLAGINWRLAFLIYAFAIITFFLAAINIPEPPKFEKRSQEGKAVNGNVMFVCIAIFIYAIIYFAFFGYISYVVEEVGGTSAQSGIASMVMTALSLIMGIIFAKILNIFKRGTLIISLLANLIGFYVLSASSSFLLIVIGAAFVGCGFGLIMPYGTVRVNEASPASSRTFANGLFMTFVNIGTAVSPFLLALIGSIFDRNNDGRFIWFVSAVLLAVGTIIAVIMVLAGKKTKVQNI